MPDYSGRKKNDSEALDYNYHRPVMLEEAIELLFTFDNGIYIDGTLGGGGHAEAILEKLASGGKLLAFDRDAEAIEYCNAKFRDELNKGDASRLVIIHSSFNQACSIESIRGEIKGLLLDLGVSSRQLDSGSKGFTFRENAPLDMRFGSDSNSAEALLADIKEDELAHILRSYGDEPDAKAIARRICMMRRVVPLKTTLQLRSVIEEVVPPQHISKSLPRVFQAIRIAVNHELEILHETLESILPSIALGGRIVVIAYHSLEDRIVKNIFKKHAISLKELNNAENNIANDVPGLKILTKKPLLPSPEEIRINPRARSAKLRAAERVF